MAATTRAGFDNNADFVPLGKAHEKSAPGDGNRKEKKKKPRKLIDGELKRRSLFVTGLPEDATNEMLEAAFGEVGPLRSCFVVCEKGEKERVCKGFGFVTYSLDADAERAIEHFKKARFMNKRLVVDYAKPRERGARGDAAKGEGTHQFFEDEPKPAAAPPKPKREKVVKKKDKNPKIWRLIIRNLGWKVTAQELKTAFEKYGLVSESTLVKDAKGRSRGFAFVQLDSKEAANHAMQKLNGTAMGGRNIAVDWALAKAKFLEHAQAKPATVAEDDEKKGDEEVVDKDKGKQKRKKKENEEANEGKEEPEPEEGGDEGNEDVEGSDDNDEENDEEDSEKKSKSKTKEPRPSDVKEGRTVFVRNLLFSATTEEVQERFAKFGEINYCVLVTDPSTGISRGSAFVQFKNKEAVDAVMREAYPYGRKQQPAKHQKRQASKSMLEGMSELLVHGRPVVVDVAVERGTAAQLKEQHVRQKDKRNLYLLNEGVIDEGTPAARGVSQSDMRKRQEGIAAAKQKLTNPNFFVSTTRLAVRNLPKDFDEKQLRELFLNAAGTEGRPRIVQVKIARDEEKATDGENKSRGFGFVEFTEHTHALGALRNLNNNATIWSADHRPIITFAIENRIELKKREDRLKRQKPNAGSAAPQQREERSGVERTKRKEPADGESASKSDKKGKNNVKSPSRQPTQAAKKPKPKVEAEAKGKPAKAAPPPKRDRDDPIAAALKDAPEETRTKKDRSGRAKKQKQEEDKFDALVEQYKKRMMGVQLKSDDWM